MKNYKLTIEYDGTAYHGWQIQASDITIQKTIETALSTMTWEKIRLSGSGRTDAGVHALGQVASFKTALSIPTNAFLAGLNSLLPDDIVITACESVADDFHARFSAKNKTYQYRIYNRPVPIAISRQYMWHIRKKLDVAAMQQAVAHITGTHDFKSFEGTGSPRDHTIRTVMNAKVMEKDDGYLIFEIMANGFLRYMVRNIVGTLADVGLLKTSPDEFKHILEAKNRNLAGATAPPQGLFLVEVSYE
ncbi:MAG: tRNA pseudouridine(38-40) synthase TruA [Desulfobacteraceae bacterium]|nr:tRNA pseudouridine(38-40) synthase TruA [Desulfobacteraceae bacterium]MBC2754874.1 tRNA pseudouridine(38-40) synthase TruA [Desulfobacteraceae bacterium]